MRGPGREGRGLTSLGRYFSTQGISRLSVPGVAALEEAAAEAAPAAGARVAAAEEEEDELLDDEPTTAAMARGAAGEWL